MNYSETEDTPSSSPTSLNDAEATGEEGTRDIPRDRERVTYRGESSDSLFGLLVAIALSIGLTPLLPEQAELRYTLSWGALAGFGVLAWLLGRSERIEREKPENLAWGIIFGLILGAPLLAFGTTILATTVHLLFGSMSIGTLLAYLIFVMPTGETLFFRGVLQETRSFWTVALLSSVWAGLLYLPLLDIAAYPAPTVVITVAIVMMNVIYGYVRQRNGLAAAWLCQITANLVLLVLPFLSS